MCAELMKNHVETLSYWSVKLCKYDGAATEAPPTKAPAVKDPPTKAPDDKSPRRQKPHA